MTISVRNVDDELFKEFKIQAKRQEKNIGDALNEAMRLWMKDKPQGLKPINQMRTWNFGEGTQNLSQEVDEILYG